MAEKSGNKIELETGFGNFFQDSRGMYTVNKAGPAEKTMIFVSADTLPAAYELALISVWKHGKEIRTHYDQKDSDGNYLFPPSREASVMVDIKNPLQEPRMHVFVPGDYEHIESYTQEVVEGIHDSWINPNDTSWTYTYWERLFNYNPSTNLRTPDRGLLLEKGVNQIEKIIEDLKRDLTSKGAQATTWMPTADPGLESNRPCLQRFWFRAYEDGEVVGLNSDWEFRSRDIYGAWFMNAWANIELSVDVAKRLSKTLDRPVVLKRVSDFSNSSHFYGHVQEKFKSHFEKFKSDEGFEERGVRTDRYETPLEQLCHDAIKDERERLRINPHYSLNEEAQRNLAEKIAKNPDATPRDRKFVCDFFPEIAKKHFPTTAKGDNSWLLGHESFMSGDTR